MIHFSCDVCKRTLDAEHDLRYVVRVEVYAALGDGQTAIDTDRDHLDEIHEILEGMDELETAESALGEDVYQQLRYDLCSDCRRKFMRDPLGRRLAGQLDFSKN